LKLPKVEVKPSPISGMGLFATEDIPWGTRIIRYTGELISDAEAERRTEAGADAIFELADDLNIDGRVGGSGAELANHSREAANSFILRDNGEVWLVAGIEGISAGDEITYDYGSDYYEID
jgi:SET domain-containing protein